jgi:hypothetical protein
MPAGPQGFSTKCRLGDTICYAPASQGAIGFPPTDNPVGDDRCCGDEPFGLRAERRPGTAAWAGQHSTRACGLELAAAWTGGRGHIRCWAGRRSTGARRLEWPATWTGGRGRIRCAADAAGHHCEDRFRRARQSRGHAGSEEAVFPRPAAAVVVPRTASGRRWLMSTPALRSLPGSGRHRRPLHAEADGSQVELEAGFISDRTKAALIAAKRRGKKLGAFVLAPSSRKGPPEGR